MEENVNVTELFGCDVFNDAVMEERLPKKVYKELKETIEEGKELSLEIADVVAHEMKEWAIEKGATHFSHWFQPMTGVTAEKHDAFITAPKENGKVLLSFSGKELIQGEPDASSFPSGGLRATFEARGYTTWDCTSPAFVRHDSAGGILCIPTAFCSYTGEALDQKTPLLRSMEAVNKQALRILRLFGNTTAKRVTPSVGAEQEYFLVDKEKWLKRKDLIYTGRTLFGAMPPKGQEMDDHYLGTIRQRVSAYMKEVNEECWKLGVAAKTQHNEVAPAQHELAPIYAPVNIAQDHNQIMMRILKKVASRHGMRCLLHEKPFAGVNGSGKHNNWSLTSDDGVNLLDPGKNPHENKMFLLVLACILKAVDEHADLLRVSAADVGNDQRLGGNEAQHPSLRSEYSAARENQCQSPRSALYFLCALSTTFFYLSNYMFCLLPIFDRQKQRIIACNTSHNAFHRQIVDCSTNRHRHTGYSFDYNNILCGFNRKNTRCHHMLIGCMCSGIRFQTCSITMLPTSVGNFFQFQFPYISRYSCLCCLKSKCL